MERIDDLQVNGLRIIQDDEGFCFGTDSVEIANFACEHAKSSDKAIDLGAGNGIISILLAGKRGIKTTAVEIDPDLSHLTQRNIALNRLESLVDVMNLPAQELKNHIKTGEYTLVVSNPPYFKMGSGLMSQKKSLARHEVSLNQLELVQAASYLLNDGGKFLTVYPIKRLAELMHNCVLHRLEPKQLIVLHSPNKPPHLFLLKCVKNAKPSLTLTTRLIKNYGIG